MKNSGIPFDSARGSLLRTASRMIMGAALTLPLSVLQADILRGGAASPGRAAATGANGGGQATPAATNQSRINANDTLSRTTQALASVKALQDAARKNAAQGGNSAGLNPRTGVPFCPPCRMALEAAA